MMRRLFLSLLLGFPAFACAADADTPQAWLAKMKQERHDYQAVLTTIAQHRKEDTAEMLQELLEETVPGTDEARSLTYRLAGVYYRQLRPAEAEELIAPYEISQGKGRPAITRYFKVREGMIPLVLKNDFTAALAYGEATVPGYTDELATATLSEEILDTAYASSAPGSDARASIGARRPEASARTLKARFELGRLISAIAEVHHALKQYPQAEQQYRAALALFQKTDSSNLVPLIHTRTGLAILLRTRGDLAAALPLQQEALTLMKKTYAPDHPERLECERELTQLRAALPKNSGKRRPGVADTKKQPGIRKEVTK